MLIRYPDWAARLEVFLHANAARFFCYWQWDCCLFVCDAIQAMTGVDLAREYRGCYGSAEEARALAKSVRAVAEQVAARHGLFEVSPQHAGRGDVVLIRRPRGHSLGLVVLNGGVLVAGAKGLMFAPRILAARAWRV